MKTKKAEGALLGLLGSLPALPFFPLAAGFSAPLLFTANLHNHNTDRRASEDESLKQIYHRDYSNRLGADCLLGVGLDGALGFGPLHGWFPAPQTQNRVRSADGAAKAGGNRAKRRRIEGESRLTWVGRGRAAGGGRALLVWVGERREETGTRL
uniref:Uncharacterized protein n=1 Tax=Aegilops tauschii subsp. strangulata TaxID=200361 RepID=A0A453TBL2_AEGTS